MADQPGLVRWHQRYAAATHRFTDDRDDWWDECFSAAFNRRTAYARWLALAYAGAAPPAALRITYDKTGPSTDADRWLRARFPTIFVPTPVQPGGWAALARAWL
jgi:hypothetical protein